MYYQVIFRLVSKKNFFLPIVECIRIGNRDSNLDFKLKIQLFVSTTRQRLMQTLAKNFKFLSAETMVGKKEQIGLKFPTAGRERKKKVKNLSLNPVAAAVKN